MSELLVNIFLSIALLTLIAVLVLVFTHLYQIFEEPNIQKRMRKLRKPMQPWVTVLLYARNNEAGVKASVKALLRSQYHNFDIVIVNDYLGDTKKALRIGYKESKKGEVVVSLQAGATVPRSFIKQSVATKGKRKQVTMRISAPTLMNSLTDVFQSLNNLLWQRTHKVHVSDADTILLAKNTHHYDFLITVLFIGIVLLSLIIKEPIILWYSWLIVTSYLLATIWLKEDRVRNKLQLSFSAFSALFFIPVNIVATLLSQLYSRN